MVFRAAVGLETALHTSLFSLCPRDGAIPIQDVTLTAEWTTDTYRVDSRGFSR